jgi:hypothetical protein
MTIISTLVLRVDCCQKNRVADSILCAIMTTKSEARRETPVNVRRYNF